MVQPSVVAKKGFPFLFGSACFGFEKMHGLPSVCYSFLSDQMQKRCRCHDVGQEFKEGANRAPSRPDTAEKCFFLSESRIARGIWGRWGTSS
jgi:hypothetical protein